MVSRLASKIFGGKWVLNEWGSFDIHASGESKNPAPSSIVFVLVLSILRHPTGHKMSSAKHVACPCVQDFLVAGIPTYCNLCYRDSQKGSRKKQKKA